MGMEAMFFARMDHTEREKRIKEHALSFLWRPSYSHFGTSKQVFTHVFTDSYGFFDPFKADQYFQNDELMITDKTLTGFNADEKLIDFVNFANSIADSREGNNIMFPWGDDFCYSNAKLSFEQLERVVSYVNAHNKANITVRISTPSEFIETLQKEDRKWPVEYDDGFPYAGGEDEFWTGYFTSKPNGKRLVKDASAMLGAFNKITSLKVIEEGVTSDTVKSVLSSKQKLFENLGIYQHHDAITGTEKQVVSDMYAFQMTKAIDESAVIYDQELKERVQGMSGLNITGDL